MIPGRIEIYCVQNYVPLLEVEDPASYIVPISTSLSNLIPLEVLYIRQQMPAESIGRHLSHTARLWYPNCGRRDSHLLWPLPRHTRPLPTACPFLVHLLVPLSMVVRVSFALCSHCQVVSNAFSAFQHSSSSYPWHAINVQLDDSVGVHYLCELRVSHHSSCPDSGYHRVYLNQLYVSLDQSLLNRLVFVLHIHSLAVSSVLRHLPCLNRWLFCFNWRTLKLWITIASHSPRHFVFVSFLRCKSLCAWQKDFRINFNKNWGLVRKLMRLVGSTLVEPCVQNQ